MKKREPVSHIMTRQPIHLQINEGLTQAEVLFKKHGIRHLPVLSGKKIMGILSLTDLRRISFTDAYDPRSNTLDPAIYSLFSLEQIMAHNPVYVSSNTPILKVAESFTEGDFHCFPVVDNEELVGIVTTTDLIKFLIDQY